MGKPEGKYARTVTVGTKGQIVLPREARNVFDIHPGDMLIQSGAKRPTESSDPRKADIALLFGGRALGERDSIRPAVFDECIYPIGKPIRSFDENSASHCWSIVASSIVTEPSSSASAAAST